MNIFGIMLGPERYRRFWGSEINKRVVYAAGEKLIAAKYAQSACHKRFMRRIELKLPFGIL